MAGLYSAVREGDLEKVQMYLEKGDNVESRGGEQDETALMAAVRTKKTDMVKLLLKNKADVNAKSKHQRTALMWACDKKQPDITAMLLDHGANVNDVDVLDQTALHYCAESGDDVSALALIQAGADINAIDIGQWTALMLACRNKQPDITAMLLDHGANLNDVDVNYRTALHDCAEYGDDVSALALIQAGADINAIGRWKRTPLMLAARWNRVDVVKVLLVMMCNKNIKDSDGETALDMARNKQHITITKLLTGDVSADPSIIFWGGEDLSDSQFNRRLHTLPPDFQCKVLLLNNNKLTNCNLTNNQFSTLATVKIANNKLTEIDGFPNTLTFLDASNNKVTTVKSVPSSLTTCQLENNPITTLESKCLENETLTSVLTKALTDKQIGKLSQPPPEVFRQGYTNIQQYFEDIRKGELVETSTARCVITGETTAGKTSLMKSLISGRSVLTDIEVRTQVLDVETWNVSDGCSMQMYDTGGHTIYDVTSTYFANNNSIVLVVHDLSSIPSVNRTMTILRRNLYQHPQNTTTFVLTHIDVLEEEEIAKRKEQFQQEVKQLLSQEIQSLVLVQKDMEADEQTEKEPIKKKDNKLTGVIDLIQMYQYKLSDSKYFTVSSKTMAGIPELRDFLISTIHKSTVRIPSKWIRCYQQLHGTDKHFYTTEEFVRCYLQAYKGLQKIFSSKSSKQSGASTCLTYLSDVGLVLIFPDHPVLKGYVFHDNHFLVSLFKSIFDHDIEKNTSYSTDDSLKAMFNEGEFQDTMKDFMENGILSHKLLKCLWGKYHLSQTDEQALVDALKLFDIFFEIQSSEDISLQKYFIPWLVKSKTAPEKITSPPPLNQKMIALKLQYTFNNHIPVNVTEQMFVRLQKFAVQHHYQGERYAWEDGLHITLGSLEMALVRQQPLAQIHQQPQAQLDQTHHQPHICLSVTGKVKDLDKIWTSLRDIYTEQKTVVQPWKGVITRCDVICFHCVLKSPDEPHRWDVAAVFSDEASKVVTEVRCPKSKELIPAALTHPLMGDDKKEQIQDVLEYLKNHWLDKFSIVRQLMHPQPVIVELRTMSELTDTETTQLKHLILEQKVDYLVEKFLLERRDDYRDVFRQALKNTSYHSNMVLADTLPGYMYDTRKDAVLRDVLLTDVEKKQILSTYKEFVQYIEPDKLTRELFASNTVDIYHKHVINSMETQEDKCEYLMDKILLRGTSETLVNFREAIAKFPENAWLLKSLPVRSLPASDNITEDRNVDSVMEKDTPSATTKGTPSVTTKDTLSVTSKDAPGARKKDTPSITSKHIPDTIDTVQYKTEADSKLTRDETQYVLDELYPSVCGIVYPGTTGTGFVIGPITDVQTGLIHRLVLTSHHLRLDEAFANRKQCKAVFEGAPKCEVDIDPHILYSSYDMDYVLVCLQHSPQLESHLANVQPLGELVTQFTPNPKDPLVLIGSITEDKKKIDFGAYSVKPQDRFDYMNVIRQRTNLYKLDDKFTFYNCHSFEGTSGSPCFSVPKKLLYAMHCGAIIKSPIHDDPEYGVLLYQVACDIEKQVKEQSQPHFKVDQLHQLFPVLKSSMDAS